MNKERLTQAAIEAERKAVGTVINILLVIILALVGYGAGYYVAMREVAALAESIVN
jgi:hypothetical protein